MGDFNGKLGNSLGERGHYAPNDRGVKLLDFANYFNLCPTNLSRRNLHPRVMVDQAGRPLPPKKT